MFREYKGESPGTVLKWTVTDSPPLYLRRSESKVQGINAVCDPQIQDFSKIESKNFPFLRQSHSPRMPGLTHPQGNQGNV